jgi:hypothetical protein
MSVEPAAALDIPEAGDAIAALLARDEDGEQAAAPAKPVKADAPQAEAPPSPRSKRQPRHLPRKLPRRRQLLKKVTPKKSHQRNPRNSPSKSTGSRRRSPSTRR